jgi:tetratricopeptide (TPR) repeat protein
MPRASRSSAAPWPRAWQAGTTAHTPGTADCSPRRTCKAGAIADGLEAIEDALGAPHNQALYLMPDLLRLRGDLLARNGNGPEAETSYREAIALAHRMGAKLIELRATTSLGRLLQSQGRAAEARELLAPLYAWFTEGFDARDLVEAKALLAELG